MRRIFRVLVTVGLGAVACLLAQADASQSVAEDRSVPLDRPTLADAQSLFYNGRYDAAAALARARVARAWIDYIVDTRMPRGTRWLLGGGSKKRALIAVREAASTEADFFIHAEGDFALWDMQVRERNLTEATLIARRLARDFPENRELVNFLEAHDPSLRL